MLREKYISPELRQKIIDDLILKEEFIDGLRLKEGNHWWYKIKGRKLLLI